MPVMAQQAKDLIQGVKSFVLIPEKWEPKNGKRRDRKDGKFEVLQGEMCWIDEPVRWQWARSSKEGDR